MVKLLEIFKQVLMSDAKKNIKKHVKNHIPKDILTELRIIYRITMEAIYGIKRTGWVNLAIITTMAAILTIFGALVRTSISMSLFSEAIGNALELSVYVKSNADTNEVSQSISRLEHVKQTKIIPREVSWKKLKSEMDVPNIENPLPDTIHVKIDNPENINQVFQKIKTLRGVEDINYAKDIAEKMQIFHSVVTTVTVIVIIIVAILTLTIINNTIQLVIQSRKEEIEIMRLMGVSNWYIKTPLILQGAIYGFLGAMIALVPMQIIQSGLINVHHFFMVPSPIVIDKIVNSVIFLFGIFFAASGSIISIKKHIQV